MTGCFTLAAKFLIFRTFQAPVAEFSPLSHRKPQYWVLSIVTLQTQWVNFFQHNTRKSENGLNLFQTFITFELLCVCACDILCGVNECRVNVNALELRPHLLWLSVGMNQCLHHRISRWFPWSVRESIPISSGRPYNICSAVDCFWMNCGICSPVPVHVLAINDIRQVMWNETG